MSQTPIQAIQTTAPIFYADTTLEAIARKVLCGYKEELYYGKPQAIPIEDLIEAQGVVLEFQYLRKNGSILGKTIFEDGIDVVWDMDNHRYIPFPVQAGTILIDASLCDEERSLGRLRFTCAHELAHWLLHKSFFEATGENANMEIQQEQSNLEVQANMLGSALLMPLPQIKRCFYGLHNQGIRQETAIVQKMANLFQVSAQAMEIRLTEHKLL